MQRRNRRPTRNSINSRANERETAVKTMKTLSITQIRMMPVGQFVKLISRREVQITRHGKAVAVLLPVPGEFRSRPVEEYLAELDRRRKAAEGAFKLRDASVKGMRKKRKHDPDWWAKIKAEERRMEEEKWAKIFPRGKSKVIDVAREMAEDLRKAGIKVDVSKHDKHFAEGVAKRKAHPKSKPARSGSKRTSRPRLTQ